MKKCLLFLSGICMLLLFVTACSSDDNNSKSQKNQIIIEPSELLFDHKVGSKEVQVQSTGKWIAKVDNVQADWVSIQTTEKTLNVSVTSNDNEQERSAVIVFVDQSNKAEVLTKLVIKQSGIGNDNETDLYSIVIPTKEDFKESYIYNALNSKGEEIARFHLEYLKSDDIAEQRVTMYLVKNSKVNFTEGVAFPDAGKLVWDLPKNTLEYVKGDKDKLTKIFIDKNAVISYVEAPGQAIEEITLSPFLLEDSRVGETMKYSLVKIGKHVWMAENLRATMYLDGTALKQFTSKEDWYELGSGGIAYYDNNKAENPSGLYNWYAVTNERGLSPKGYRVSSDNDWISMVYYLDPSQYGIDQDHGGARESETTAPLLKSTSKWQFNDALNKPGDGNNLSGLNIYAEGSTSSSFYFDFSGKGRQAYFWTSTTYEEKTAMFRRFYFDEVFVNRWFDNYNNGYTVRCLIDVKDM